MVSKHAHCLKPLAALVFDCSDGRTTAGEIARTAEQRLGNGVSEADVADAVSQLGSLGLLQTPLVVLPGVEGNGNGVSRREMLRRVGFAGAAAATATTLVTSIVAPTPALAASGIPSGCSGCRATTGCISNHCCQSNPGKQCDQSCCVGLNNSCHITGCKCVGGTRAGLDCTADTCPGGTCVCHCTVCASNIAWGNCPTTCPGGATAVLHAHLLAEGDG